MQKNETVYILGARQEKIKYTNEVDKNFQMNFPNTYVDLKGDCISLDPGVRKFLTGYDSNRGSTTIRAGDNKRLLQLLVDIDKQKSARLRQKQWRRIKNLITDLHWKTIKYLTSNYQQIIMGDIRISKLLKKKDLPRRVKRFLAQYSFFGFKQRLTWKGNLKKRDVVLVDESFTSKTCSECGTLNNVKKSETYRCKNCKVVQDRDLNGAKNIMIKALTLTSNSSAI